MAFRHDRRYRIWLIQKKQRERQEAMEKQSSSPKQKEGSNSG